MSLLRGFIGQLNKLVLSGIKAWNIGFNNNNKKNYYMLFYVSNGKTGPEVKALGKSHTLTLMRKTFVWFTY